MNATAYGRGRVAGEPPRRPADSKGRPAMDKAAGWASLYWNGRSTRPHARSSGMKNRLELGILPQPDDTTCGPTCLHAVYRYYGDPIGLDDVIAQISRLEHGGTFAVYLGTHALRRGYPVTLYTYNLQVFDPTWFQLGRDDMIARLRARRIAKADTPLAQALDAYLEFLEAGGEVMFEDLTAKLIRGFLKKGIPIITGLSATYLYKTMREYGPFGDDDDIRGDPSGHFVVLCGYDKEDRTVLVADPLHPNPAFQGLQYVVEIDRLVCAILLGILTHDADLLVIEPVDADDDRRMTAAERANLLFDLPRPTNPPSPMATSPHPPHALEPSGQGPTPASRQPETSAQPRPSRPRNPRS